MMFINKPLTREAAIERYGAIDFASRHWADVNKWLTLLEVPKEFKNLTIENTGIPCRHIACNRDMAPHLMGAFDLLINRKLQDYLVTYDGCLAIRMVRGSPTEFSAHSYGLAIDFNAATNQLGTRGDMRLDVVRCFSEVGWDWGGDFKRLDPMHFSRCFEGK